MNHILTVLKSLSDETRLRIINLLYEKELCVCDIMEVLQIPQTKASRHLSYLKNAGLVTDRKQGQWVYYSLTPEGKMKLIQSLVFDHLRQLPQSDADLTKLQDWLKQKTLQCD
jgi:ArsR family transcriptional regulator